jgi:hypothetical protein
VALATRTTITSTAAARRIPTSTSQGFMRTRSQVDPVLATDDTDYLGYRVDSLALPPPLAARITIEVVLASMTRPAQQLEILGQLTPNPVVAAMVKFESVAWLGAATLTAVAPIADDRRLACHPPR